MFFHYGSLCLNHNNIRVAFLQVAQPLTVGLFLSNSIVPNNFVTSISQQSRGVCGNNGINECRCTENLVLPILRNHWSSFDSRDWRIRNADFHLFKSRLIKPDKKK